MKTLPAGRTARSEKATARILQKASSHITNLSRQKSDRAVLISGAEEAAFTRYDFLIGFGVRKAASRTRYGNSSYFPEPCHSAHNIKGRAYNTESDRKGNNVIDKQITAKRQSHIIA